MIGKSLLFCLLLQSALWGFEMQTHFIDIKQRIERAKEVLKEEVLNEKRSSLFFELALAYCQDQEIDLAFQAFLEALKTAPSFSAPPISQEENELYTRALENYLAHSGNDPVKAAQELVAGYGKIAEQRADFLHLNFLVGTAYANLGEYAIFFSRIYEAFPYLRETFLADKIQGILNLRLAKHAIVPHERQQYQRKAFSFVNAALDKNQKDTGLYKVLIYLAKENEKEEVVLSCLKKIVENAVPILRGDLIFYVEQAASLYEFDLAQEMIDQASTLYHYSRAISAAQDYLNQNRGEYARTNSR